MSEDPKEAESPKPRVPPPPTLSKFPSPQPVDRTAVSPNPLDVDHTDVSQNPLEVDRTDVAASPLVRDRTDVGPPTEVVEDAPTGKVSTAAPQPVSPQTTEPATVDESAEGKAPAGEAESSGAKRPPALPRPQRLGSSKPAADFRDAPHPVPSSSSGTSSVPKGIKPPPIASAVPDELESEDTDVLIASVADAMALEAEQDAARAAAESAAAKIDAVESAGGAAASAPAVAARQEGHVPTVAAAASEDSDFEARPAWLPWAAVGGIVAVVLFAFVAWPSDDEPEAEATPQAAAEEAPKPKTEDGSLAAAEVEPEDAPPVVAPPDDPAVEEGAVAVPDLGGGEDPMLEDVEVDTAQPDAESEGAPDETVEGETADSSAAAGKRRNKGKSRKPKNTASPEPKTTPQPKPKATDTSASDLLSQARSQLSKGRAPEAYRLASESYRKARSASALQVMAKAGCRMGNKSKAKRAFDKLSVGQRAGIRAECRKHGVKLGI